MARVFEKKAEKDVSLMLLNSIVTKPHDESEFIPAQVPVKTISTLLKDK
jgi:hypothetical protein